MPNFPSTNKTGVLDGKVNSSSLVIGVPSFERWLGHPSSSARRSPHILCRLTNSCYLLFVWSSPASASTGDTASNNVRSLPYYFHYEALIARWEQIQDHFVSSSYVSFWHYSVIPTPYYKREGCEIRPQNHHSKHSTAINRQLQSYKQTGFVRFCKKICNTALRH